jgi:hypothetical protein
MDDADAQSYLGFGTRKQSAFMVKSIGCGTQLAAKRSGDLSTNEVVERLPPVIGFIIRRRITTPSLEDCVFLIKPLEPFRRLALVQLNSSTA